MAIDIWPIHKVGTLLARGVLAINDGYRFTNKELGPVGVPFVRGGDIGDGSISTHVEDHVLPQFHDRIANKLSQPEDIAFITKGTVGRVGYLRAGQPQVVFAPQVSYWRVLDRRILNPRFIYYQLRSRDFQAQLNAVKTQGSMAADYVSLSDQASFQIAIPPIAQQDAISEILGSLDDKIDLNRRMNQTLEAMTQALFRSWFVDFDPVQAKAESRSPDGMDAKTAALFPSSFIQTELGQIPSGWSLRTLDEVAVLQRGFNLPSTERQWSSRESVLRSGGFLASQHHSLGQGVSTFHAAFCLLSLKRNRLRTVQRWLRCSNP